MSNRSYQSTRISLYFRKNILTSSKMEHLHWFISCVICYIGFVASYEGFDPTGGVSEHNKLKVRKF